MCEESVQWHIRRDKSGKTCSAPFRSSLAHTHTHRAFCVCVWVCCVHAAQCSYASYVCELVLCTRDWCIIHHARLSVCLCVCLWKPIIVVFGYLFVAVAVGHRLRPLILSLSLLAVTEHRRITVQCIQSIRTHINTLPSVYWSTGQCNADVGVVTAC